MTVQHPIPPTGPYDPIFGLQEKVASLLTPIFQDSDTDELFAYQIACRSLQAYEPESRADFVNIGRTIAFSLASLALLKDAFHAGLHLEDKKRVAVHANALNRSADQAERSMMERRRHQRAYPTFPVPHQTAPEPQPRPEPPEPQARPEPPEPAATCDKASTNPAKPTRNAIHRAPPPVHISAIQHVGTPRASMAAKHAAPLITPAILQAVNPASPPLPPR